jgi:hypothetical protein
MTMLSRDQILAFRGQRKKELVEVPEWDGSVYVAEMTGTERDAFEGETFKMKGKNVEANTSNIRARLAARTMVDEDGKRLFSDQDVYVLGELSAAALDRVFAVAQRINGFSQADLDELAKN